MENENKNLPKQNQGEKKRRPHRPKGYFIEPNGQKPSAPSNATSTVTEAQKNSGTGSEQKPQGGNQSNRHRTNHNKKRHGKGNRDCERAPRNVAAEEQKTVAPQQQKSQPEGEQRQRPNKNKQKNKQRPKTETPDNVKAQAADTVQPSQEKRADKAPVADSSKRQQKKRYEKPQTKPAPTENTAINTEEYEPVRFPSVDEEKVTVTEAVETEPVPMIEVVGIRFKSSGKTYYFAPNGNKLKRGEHAIVETARGLEYGDVAMGNSMVKESDTVPPLRPVIRAATPADVKHHEENKKKEDEAFTICNEKILAHKLDMKLIDAQFTFDNSKLLFYFTSAGRVDFRDLVKDLAGVFRTRIELRQIGIRDEAKIMGGVGMCGRPLCCTLFLSDFGQVSIKMAKEQNLSLNCAKISGICGRLMCCLRYEHETYEYEIKRTPPVDSFVQTADGTGTVTEINPLQGTVKVRLSASPENPPKLYKREDVVMLQKKGGKNTSEK